MLKNTTNPTLLFILSTLSLGIVSFTGCQQHPTTTKTKPPVYTALPMQKNKPTTMYNPRIDQPHLWENDFKQFYQENQLYAQKSYVSFLKKHRHDVPPLHELMRSAKSWQECASQRYSLPYFELWQNMLPTIDVLNELQTLGILTNFEITSGYRDIALNTCAKGSTGSKHLLNAALDIKPLGEQATAEGNIQLRNKLCDFWKEKGAELKMGLGLYANGQIHIDTQGFRTWGPDYSWHTSICEEQIIVSEKSIGNSTKK